MPLYLSRGGISLRLRPQDLIRRLHNPTCEAQDKSQEKIGGAGIRCLPQRKHGKPPEGMDAVRRLSGDVEELMQEMELMQANPSCAGGGVDGAHCNERHRMQVSLDVQKHMHTILDLIKDLTGEKNERPACQRHMPSEDAVELLEQLIAADLPVQLLAHLPLLEFEARKGVMNVCCALLWPGMPQQIDRQVVEYLRCHPKVFHLLVEGYAHEQTALHCGVVLRSFVRHRELVEAFLRSGQVLQLAKFARHPTVDISSDAFYTLREVLLAHKDCSAAWLDTNSQGFFQIYNELLKSGEYLAERQALKLLAEMLLDRHFRRVMLTYISDEQNLAIHMILLKDYSKAIQIEAFHVFKIFVANPHKPFRVQQILFKNKEKLMAHLDALPSLRPDEKKFGDEVRNVLERVRNLSAPMPLPRLARSVTAEAATSAPEGRGDTAEGPPSPPPPRKSKSDPAEVLVQRTA